MSEDSFEFEALPPERRRSRSIIVASGSCCCCCCCCLHTIGGLVGAAIGSADNSVPGVHTGLADRLYWLNVLILVMLTLMYGMVMYGTGDRDELLVAGIGLALGLPVVQLIASILSAGLVLISPAQDKGACLKRIGRITAWSTGLALLGAAPFVALMVIYK